MVVGQLLSRKFRTNFSLSYPIDRQGFTCSDARSARRGMWRITEFDGSGARGFQNTAVNEAQ